MATTEEYKNGGSASYSFSIEYIKAEDIKVTVDGTELTYTATNPPAQTTEYTVNGSNVIFKQASVSGSTNGGVRIYRETALEDADSATFHPGSSIRAADLNANHKLVRFSAQEKNQQIVTADIKDQEVTSEKIKDLTIVDGDIASNAEIEVYKLKDGAANQVLVTQSDGTTTNWSSNLDLPGTLDVTGNVDLDSNLNVDGTTTLDNTTVDGVLDVNGSTTIDNVRIDGNEIDTSSGDLIIDSASGDTRIDDDARVTGTFTVDGQATFPNLVTVTGSQLKIQADNSEFAVNNGSGVTKFKVDSDNGDTLIQGTASIANIDGAAVVTSGTSTSDTKFYSAKRSDELYYRKGTADDIEESGVPWSGNDSTIATTAAIDARIIDLVDDVGGFVPIANETSFPTSNPDINNPATGGTIVSVKAASTNLAPSGTTVTIANGRGSGLPVVITGVSATIPSGFGFLVETTTTDHTYAFHRLVPKATEVTAVAGKATEITRLGTADAVADMAILGTADVVADLNTLATADVVSDMNTLATADVVSDMNTLAVTSVVNNMDTVATNVANVNTTAGSISNVNTTAGSISNVNTVAGSIANVNTTAGSIGNVNTVAGSIASVNNASSNLNSINNFGDKYQVAANNPSTDGGGNALAEGDLYFNTSANELKVYNGSSWQAGVTATGNFASTTGNTFTGDNRYNDNVKALFGTGSDLEIYHSGSESWIKDVGTGSLYIGADRVVLQNAAVNETTAMFNQNGSADLYYDNSKKLETKSDGIDVTGEVQCDSLDVDGAANISSVLTMQSYIQGTGTLNLYGSSSSSNGLALATDGNVTLQGDLDLQDNDKLLLGASDDLQIYHSGSHSYIQEEGTGSLYVDANQFYLRQASDDTVLLYTTSGGEVRIQHNGNDRIRTESGGVTVTGNITVSGTVDGVDIAALNTTVSNLTTDLVADTSPQLGGDLDVNNHNILFTDQDEARFGSDNDMQISHNGSDGYIVNKTGDLNIYSKSGEAGAVLVPNGTTKLYYDGSKKLETTNTGISVAGNGVFTGNVSINDNNYLYVGNSGDLRLFHDGTDSHIQNTQNSGELKIRSHQTDIKNADNNETQAIFHENAAVELYYDNSKKLQTYGSGVEILGNLWLQSSGSGCYLNDNVIAYFGNGGDLKIYHSGTESWIRETGTGALYLASNQIVFNNAATNENMAKFTENGAVELYFDNSKKFYTQSVGARVEGRLYVTDYIDAQNHIYLGDSKKVICGNSSDLQIYHSGTESWIKETGVGSLFIESSKVVVNDNAEFIINGAAELYYDGAKKIETQTHGTNVPGGCDIRFGDGNWTGSGVKIQQHSNYLYICGGGNGIVFREGNSDRWYIDGSGNFKPAADSTYDIGENSGRVRNVYADNYYGDGSNLTGVGGTNTPSFKAYLSSSSQSVSNASTTKVQADTEIFDTDGCYNTSNYRFTPTTAGRYYIFCQVQGNSGNGNFNRLHARIYKNGSQVAVGESRLKNQSLTWTNTTESADTIQYANGSSDYFEFYADCRSYSGGGNNFQGGTDYETYWGAFKLIE